MTLQHHHSDNTQFVVPRELLEKYNQAVPRYTSYPPANLFGTFTDRQYKQALKESNSEEPQNISIYIHIPFCHKICFYCGCNSIRMNQSTQIADYIEAVKKEIKMVKQYLDGKRKVSQIHYGGGTPNAINHSYLTEINQLIFDEFTLTDNPEIAIECHPAHLDNDYIEALTRARFNRVSLGIQDFNPQVLKTVNREPSLLPVKTVMETFRSLNEAIKINLDFIYGLPGQTPESFGETIQQAIALKPDRIVTFSYAHVPWIKKYQEALERAGLPQPDTKLRMFETAFAIAAKAGYREVGMDHFALPEDELVKALDAHSLHRNFQGYCTRRTTGQVYAFGVSGISQFNNHYTQNTKDIPQYISQINNGEFAIEKGYTLNENEKTVREVIDNLMCNRQIVWKELSESLHQSEKEIQQIVGYNEAAFEQLINDQLVEINDQGINVTSNGRFFIRNIAVLLDPTFKGGNGTYSKSV